MALQVDAILEPDCRHRPKTRPSHNIICKYIKILLCYLVIPSICGSELYAEMFLATENKKRRHQKIHESIGYLESHLIVYIDQIENPTSPVYFSLMRCYLSASMLTA